MPTFIVLLGFAIALSVLISVIAVIADLVDGYLSRRARRNCIFIKRGEIHESSSGRPIRSVLREG